ncbi:Phage integrase family protein [Burkholderia sp. CF099]|nr:Phage integrase family protein [Burkholderia sp. CF099]
MTSSALLGVPARGERDSDLDSAGGASLGPEKDPLNPYFIRNVVRESGERLSLLCRRSTGQPLFDPTCYAVAELRGAGHASATIEQALRAVMALYLIFDRMGVDLDVRFQEFRVLEPHEVEDLMRQCLLPFRRLVADEGYPGNVIPLDGSSAIALTEDSDVLSRRAYAIRLLYIRDYLRWLSPHRVARLRLNRDPRADQMEAAFEQVLSLLGTRIPKRRGRAVLGQREGLSKEQRARLLAVIDPAAPDNPWTSAHARERNRAMIRTLLKLGCRRGELLGLRVRDVNFATGMVRIVRKADDPTDPRMRQPLVKTLDREVALGEEVTTLVRQYVRGARQALKGARRHGFLFVANGSGAPLSLDGLSKAFSALRRGCPDLPSDLSPHVLRHTWNDEFSEYADRAGMSEAEEMQVRNYAMGWQHDSGSSQFYLRRHTRERAAAAQTTMQNKLVGKINR